MSKWDREQRYEFALQWENVGQGGPQWRYWDPNRLKGEQWVSLNSKITQCLQGNQWHTFTLHGKIIDELVYYQSFTINDQTYSLGLTVSPISTPGEKDRFAIAVQLDGNSEQTPYDVFLDQVSFVRGFVTPEPSAPTATFTPTSRPKPTRTPTPPPPALDCSSAKIDPPLTDPNGQVDKTVKISWSPSACKMNVQFYQGGALLRQNIDGDFSGTIDLSNIPSGVTEIKIWIPGSSFPSDAIWVQIK